MGIRSGCEADGGHDWVESWMECSVPNAVPRGMKKSRERS
jgi:hypothetical protein